MILKQVRKFCYHSRERIWYNVRVCNEQCTKRTIKDALCLHISGFLSGFLYSAKHASEMKQSEIELRTAKVALAFAMSVKQSEIELRTAKVALAFAMSVKQSEIELRTAKMAFGKCDVEATWRTSGVT